MKHTGTLLILFLLWLALTWPTADAPERAGFQAILAGAAAALAVTWIMREDRREEGPPRWTDPVRWFWAVVTLAVLAYYVVKANLDVAYRVLHPALPIHPGIVRIQTGLRTAAGRAALANAITLTPGTLTVALTDGGDLYVHWIEVRSRDPVEAAQLVSGRFEPLIRRVFE